MTPGTAPLTKPLRLGGRKPIDEASTPESLIDEASTPHCFAFLGGGGPGSPAGLLLPLAPALLLLPAPPLYVPVARPIGMLGTPRGGRMRFSAGLRIWKEHMSVSSTLIIAPALSNSPQ